MQGSTGENGTTLIETLIALSLGAIVIYGSIEMIERMRRSTANNSAMTQIQSEAQEITSLLHKDIVYLNQANANAVTASGSALTLDGVSDQIVYTSSCQPAPASLASLDPSSAMPSGCLSGGACPVGQLPVLTITRSSGQPTKIFPAFRTGGGSGSQSAVGTMACFTPAVSMVLVALTHFYIDQVNHLKTSTRHLTFPIRHNTGIQIHR